MHKAVLGDRALFPNMSARAYLNHCAISPPSAPVSAIVAEVVDDFGRRGVSAFTTWMARREQLRSELAALIGAQPAEIGLTKNTSEGVIAAALCIPWQRGDRIVCFDGEFPTNVTPWQNAARQHDLQLTMIPQDLDALEDSLRAGVRLVAVSAVQFQTGRRMPLDAIGHLCRQHGAELFVDAIQACGICPIDVGETVDYLACGAHKWLMGLDGAGFLYVRDRAAAALNPVVAGWLGHEGAMKFLFEGPGHLRYDRPLRRAATVVESGMTNTVGFAALGVSLDLIQQIGVPEIFAHANAYLDRLEPALTARGFTSARAPQVEARSGMLSVRPPEGVDVIRLNAGLVERGISTSTPDGYLRFAPHWPNALSETDAVIDAIDEALA